MIGVAIALAALMLAPKAIRYGEWRRRVRDRKRMLATARRRADKLGRKLVVIGDPGGGVTHQTYDDAYGDVCIDLTGCPKAPSNVVRLALDVSTSIPLESDAYVVFVCYVLELVPEIDNAYAEILRIAGSEENIFMLALAPTEMATRTYPGVRWHIHQMPPSGPLEYAPITRSSFFARHL
jgi:hypothetical protein